MAEQAQTCVSMVVSTLRCRFRHLDAYLVREDGLWVFHKFGAARF